MRPPKGTAKCVKIAQRPGEPGKKKKINRKKLLDEGAYFC